MHDELKELAEMRARLERMSGPALAYFEARILPAERYRRQQLRPSALGAVELASENARQARALNRDNNVRDLADDEPIPQFFSHQDRT
jgi:hypothetical protein